MECFVYKEPATTSFLYPCVNGKNLFKISNFSLKIIYCSPIIEKKYQGQLPMINPLKIRYLITFQKLFDGELLNEIFGIQLFNIRSKKGKMSIV